MTLVLKNYLREPKRQLIIDLQQSTMKEFKGFKKVLTLVARPYFTPSIIMLWIKWLPLIWRLGIPILIEGIRDALITSARRCVFGRN